MNEAVAGRKGLWEGIGCRFWPLERGSGNGIKSDAKFQRMGVHSSARSRRLAIWGCQRWLAKLVCRRLAIGGTVKVGAGFGGESRGGESKVQNRRYRIDADSFLAVLGGMRGGVRDGGEGEG